MEFSPTGYKMLLGSDQGYGWIWDIKEKPYIIHKFSSKEQIGQTGFFGTENVIGLMDREHSQFRFYDLSNGITERSQKVAPVFYHFYTISFNESVFIVTKNNHPFTSLLKIDRHQLTLNEEIVFEKEINSTPITLKEEECFIFTESTSSKSKTLSTDIIKYDSKQNTYHCLKSVKGFLRIIAYLKDEVICYHDKQIVRYHLEK